MSKEVEIMKVTATFRTLKAARQWGRENLDLPMFGVRRVGKGKWSIEYSPNDLSPNLLGLLPFEYTA